MPVLCQPLTPNSQHPKKDVRNNHVSGAVGFVSEIVLCYALSSIATNFHMDKCVIP